MGFFISFSVVMDCRFGIKKHWNLYRNLIQFMSPFELHEEKSSEVESAIWNRDKCYSNIFLQKTSWTVTPLNR
jgi:hypothetical protein